jgi:hypothetical protein
MVNPRDYITARSFCFFSLPAADLKVFMTGNASNLSFSGGARRAFGKSEVDNGSVRATAASFYGSILSASSGRTPAT